jgi:tRNA dimethylallyltransferase
MPQDSGLPAIFLMGPTASGKSALALWLASQLPLEIVNADAMQVYRGMDIGTAKPTGAERALVPHHLFDLVSPDTSFSAGRYRDVALDVARDCQARGVIPLFTGGSGLYLRVLEHGLADIPAIDPSLQSDLRRAGEQKGWPALHAELYRIDPRWASRIPPMDQQRIMRGLSVYLATGTPLSCWHDAQHQHPPDPGLHPLLKLAISPPRETLYRRIDLRFDQMMADGLLAETTALWHHGYDRNLPAMKAVGYRQLFAYLDGQLALADAVQQARQASRHYAKRQWTWLRRETGVHWLTPPPTPIHDRHETDDDAHEEPNVTALRICVDFLCYLRDK